MPAHQRDRRTALTGTECGEGCVGILYRPLSFLNPKTALKNNLLKDKISADKKIS